MGKFMKIAMTVGHMKSVLRDLRRQGVQIHRTPEQIRKSLVDEYQSRIGEVPLLGRYLAMADKKYNVSQGLGKHISEVMDRGGPMAMGDHTITSRNKHIYLPRNFTLAGGAATSPRAIALHEAGHMEHMLDDSRGFQLALKGNNRQHAAELRNKLEAIANNNAILRMRQSEVSPEMIEKYKQIVTPAFETYRRNLDNAYKALPEGMTQLGAVRQIILNRIRKRKLLDGLNIGENPIPARAEEFRRPWSPEVGDDAPAYEDHNPAIFEKIKKLLNK